MTFFPTPVLVGVDGSQPSRHALLTAAELCTATRSPLHLAHIKLTSGTLQGRPMTPAQRDRADAEGYEFLKTERAAVIDAGTGEIQIHLRYAENIEHELVRTQDQLVAGLLIIGGNPRGSLAERMFRPRSGPAAIRRSAASVMVVRPPSEHFG